MYVLRSVDVSSNDIPSSTTLEPINVLKSLERTKQEIRLKYGVPIGQAAVNQYLDEFGSGDSF